MITGKDNAEKVSITIQGDEVHFMLVNYKLKAREDYKIKISEIDVEGVSFNKDGNFFDKTIENMRTKLWKG